MCSLQFTPTYPRTPPTLELSEPKGITQKECTELLAVLVKKAGELVGEVMVYELVVTAGKHLQKCP